METVEVYVVESHENNLSKVEILRGLVTEKLTVAVQEILAVVETAVAGYDSEVLLLKRELEKQKKQLEAILQPEVRLYKTEAITVGEAPTKVSHEEESTERDEEEGDCASGDISDSSVPCPATEERPSDDDDTKKNLQSSNVEKRDLVEHKVNKPATSELEEQPPGISIHRDEQEDGDGEDEDDLDPTENAQDEENSTAPKSKTRISSEEVNCKVCGLLFNSQPALTKHVLSFHLDNPKVLCGVCGKHLETPEELKIHVEDHEKLLQCDISDSSVPRPATEEHPSDEEEPVNNGRRARTRRRKRVNYNVTYSDSDGEWNPDTKKNLRSSNVEKKDLVEHKVNKPATRELEEQPPGTSLHRDEQEDMGSLDSAAQGEDGEDEDDLNPTESSEDEEHSAAPKSKTRISKEQVNCKVCGLLFISKPALTKHVLSFHLNNPKVQCGVCGEHLETPEELKSHVEAHKKIRQCEKCQRYYLTSKGLRNHSAVCQTGQRAYPKESPLKKSIQCDRCPLTFRFKSQLQSHYVTHSGEKPFCCEICGKCLTNYVLYCAHKMSHTGEKSFICQQCGKSFPSMLYLKRHEKIHSDREKTHLCDICSKAFYTKPELKTHQMRKHGEMPLAECPVCGKQMRGMLKHHMRIHSEERPYSCTECGMKFKTSNARQNHMDVHRGVKPFSCSACEYTCSRKEHLKVHMSTHTGQRPYRCSLCDRSFTQSHCLKSHMKKQHT